MSSGSFAPLPLAELSTLAVALDAQRMKQTFASLAPAHLGDHIQVRNVRVDVIRRRHADRCVIRYLVDAFDPHTQRRVDWGVIGKVYVAHRGERVFESMKGLWENGFSRAADGISMPRPLGFVPSLRTLFQEMVPGLPVSTLIRQSPEPMLFRRLAQVIAKLHRSPLTLLNRLTVQDHLRSCHPPHVLLARACPELASLIQYIVETASKVENKFPGESFVPVHGDFHPGQVHMENGNAWLIDFDALGCGDPAADLGNLLVILRGKAGKVPGISQFVETFKEEYFSMMDSSIAERIPLYEALTHLRRACKCLRLQDEGWQRKAAWRVQQAVQCLESVGMHDRR